MGLEAILYAYLLGGVTFIPLLIIGFIYLHPKQKDHDDDDDDSLIVQNESTKYEDFKAAELDENMNSGLETYISGWIYVTQEYIESTAEISNSLQTVADSHDNKNAYSSLYKIAQSSEDHYTNSSTLQNTGDDTTSSITTSNGSDYIKNINIEPSTSNSPDEEKKNLKSGQKKHRYYAVLRHGNLFLYKNETKTNLKHVIVLKGQIVTIWPRNVPDGQLFTNRTCLCIMKKDFSRPRRLSEGVYANGNEYGSKITAMDILTEPNLSPPKGSFFLYFDTNIVKEDWYFTLINATKFENSPNEQTSDSSTKSNTSSSLDPTIMAKSLHFKTANMIDLIQTLHSSQGQFQTRWLNAMIGRMFLALQKTELLHDYLKGKIEKKLIKINKPGFLDDFTIVKIDVGNSAPYFTYPSLKEISPDGTLVTSTNVHYHGGLSFQIATKLNINLGVGKYTKGEVDVLLSIQICMVEGRVLIKFKPAPSERLWYTFEKEPEIKLKIEPIVSSRQLTYSIITSTIEKKLKDAIKESLVFPHWDDIVFFDTTNEIYRGGIWDKTVRTSKPTETQSSDVATATETSNKKTENLSKVAKSSLENSKTKLSSTFTDISNKLRKNKSSTTSVNIENCLSDGSVVNKANVVNVKSLDNNDQDSKTYGMNTLKKIGKWYFKDSNNQPDSNEGTTEIDYKPPEMIVNRRPRRSSASSTEFELPARTSNISSASVMRKKSYDMFSKEPDFRLSLQPAGKSLSVHENPDFFNSTTSNGFETSNTHDTINKPNLAAPIPEIDFDNDFSLPDMKTNLTRRKPLKDSDLLDIESRSINSKSS